MRVDYGEVWSMSTKASYKFYRRFFRFVYPFICFFRPFEVVGRENIFKGAAIICSNHSAMIDPFLIALACKIDTHVHVIAKIELFKTPVVSTVLRKLGMICVDRGILDIAAIKSSLTYLKRGEKVVIFPEGTRKSSHDALAAKAGAVKLAERAGVPVLPVFIPRKKPFFKKSRVVFGESYHIEKQPGKRTADDYAKLSEELMNKIQSLSILS